MLNEQQSEVRPGQTSPTQQSDTVPSTLTQYQKEAIEELDRAVMRASPTAFNYCEIRLDWETANQLRMLIHEYFPPR